MKKVSMIVMFAVLFLIGFVTSCSRNAPDQGEMQKPVTQSEGVNNGHEAGEREDDDAQMDSKQTGTGSVSANDQKADYLADMQEAYKGETTASAKYAAYSAKAEAEGFHEIALLFSAASASEKTHANNHRAVLEEAGQKVPVITPSFTVKSTKENLQDAIAGETYEITTMYPAFLSHANAAGNQLALVSLNYAYKTEQKHKVFYEKALTALEGNQVKSLPSNYYVCTTCGNTYENTAPRRCGISMTSAEKFVRISTITS